MAGEVFRHWSPPPPPALPRGCGASAAVPDEGRQEARAPRGASQQPFWTEDAAGLVASRPHSLWAIVDWRHLMGPVSRPSRAIVYVLASRLAPAARRFPYFAAAFYTAVPRVPVPRVWRPVWPGQTQTQMPLWRAPVGTDARLMVPAGDAAAFPLPAPHDGASSRHA